MHYRPPQTLVALLARLQLVDDAAWNSLEPYIRSLSAEVPAFESVWIDALRQARMLTHFQASVLHSGRGDSLLVDRYVLYDRAEGCFFADAYRVRELDSEVDLRLTEFAVDERDASDVSGRLRKLLAAHGKLAHDSLASLIQVGANGNVAWSVGPWSNGLTAAGQMLRRGRFDPTTVLEIARAMVAQLAELETAGLCHADISAHSLIVLSDGSLAMPQAGVRAIARPTEGFAHLDIRPEACDGLAPERVAEGGRPTTASDMFACGCLWWHLLCGRGAFGGGDNLSRLKIAHEGKIAPVQQWASDVPELLNKVIVACTQRSPSARPASFKELAAYMGTTNYRAKQRIASIIGQRSGSGILVPASSRRRRRRFSTTQIGTFTGLVAIAVLALVWPVWSTLTNRRNVVVASTQAFASSPKTLNEMAHFVGASSTELPSPHVTVDRAVSQANYQQPVTTSDIVLSAAKPIPCTEITLRPGCKVTAAPGQRAKVLVPPEGWTVACERTCFVNIDFSFGINMHPQMTGRFSPSAAAGHPFVVRLLDLQADQVEFQGCTFLAENYPMYGHLFEGELMRWSPASQGPDSALALPSGRLRFKNSRFINAGIGINVTRPGAAMIEMNNVLYAGGGVCIALGRLPAVDEPLQISLFAMTMRDSNAFLSVQDKETTKSPGEIAVDATSCVFANRSAASLVLIDGNVAADTVLHVLKWSGQGSLLASKTPFARARSVNGLFIPVDDSAANVAGLVRDDVEFAGPLAGGVANSRVVGWHAPLQSPDAPGAVVEQLPVERK